MNQKYRIKRCRRAAGWLKGKLIDVFFNGYSLLNAHRRATASEKLRLIRVHLSYSYGFSTVHDVRTVSRRVYERMYYRKLGSMK